MTSTSRAPSAYAGALRPDPRSDQARRDRRASVVRALASICGLIALLVIVVVALLHSLDRPWLKRRLLALAATSTGLEIDYRTAHVDLLSGARLEGLVVRSPADFRPFAPDLVTIGRVDASWSWAAPWRALFGARASAFGRVTVSDVTLTVVVDERGTTSFDPLSTPGVGSRPRRPEPLSGRAATFLSTAPLVRRLAVGPVALVVVRTNRGQVSERWTLRDLAITIDAVASAPPATGERLALRVGSPTAPLAVELTRAGAQVGSARASVWAQLDASANAMTAALDLRMIDQTLAASVSADRWLYAEAALRFDAAAGRTDVALDRIEAGDGALTAEASIEVPDEGAPIVRRARGEVDLARLLHWLPPGLLPVNAEKARARWQLDSWALGPEVARSESGSLAVDAQGSNVEVDLPGGSLRVGRGALSIHAEPSGGGAAGLRGSLNLDDVRGTYGAHRLGVDGLALEFDGQRGRDEAIGGRVDVHLARFEREGASRIVARDGHVVVAVDGLRPTPQEPLATRGDVSLSADVGSLDVRSPGSEVAADGLILRVHATLAGAAPYAGALDARASRLRVVGREARVLTDAPAHADVRVRDVRPDPGGPQRTRGTLEGTLDLGALHASLEATKEPDAVDFAFRTRGPGLDPVRPLLPPVLTAAMPWERMAFAVHSTGRLQRLGGGLPELRQETQIDVERPAFGSVAARTLSLTLRSKGTTLRHQVDADLRLPGLTFEADPPSDEQLTLSAKVDGGRPSFEWKIASRGHATTELSGSASFDPTRRALLYEAALHLAELAPLGPLAARVRGLDAFDLSRMQADVSARGALLGVVTAIGGGGAIELEAHPSRTAGVEGTADVRLAHFRWARGDTAIGTPAFAWHGEMHAAGPRRTLDGHVEIGTLHIDLGDRDVDLNGIHDEASVTVLGDLAAPDVALTQHLSIGAVEQDVVAEYPLRDFTLALSAERGPEGVLHIANLEAANGGGGTAIRMSGNVDLGEGARTLSMSTSLTQDLARLSAIPDRFKGRGEVTVEANVTSPDLSLYRVRATVKGKEVTVNLPRSGIDIESANAEVPVAVALEVGAGGIVLRRSAKESPYSMLRFADQHPLLARSGFLSIARVKTPLSSIAPLVGNLEIDQNIVSLRQFEMGVRGGTITGQCGLDWDGAKSTVELHVRATGVRSSHGEPFDGNIAVAISAADRTIEGRAEVLRIGARHLLDLLDLDDPLHVDPAMNRVRSALAFGYPDNLRLVFDHGFASAHLELGGLARFVRIGELRGIPMGPIIDRMAASMIEGSGAKEAP